ncbi:MAG: excinuclease ABC subunit UvrC, partial [Pseudomonadota bacterium]
QQASERFEYEKAAKLRDQIRALNYIQNKNSNLFNIENADVIGIAKMGDIACIQLFIFRNGQNYGNKIYFFEQVLDENIEKILEIYLVQYYQNNPIPKEVILSIPIEEKEEIEKAFGLKITISKPGDKASIFVNDNANNALNRKYEDKSKRITIFRELEKIFDIKNPIKRIEVYDNSHIMGAHAVGAMIVATEEGFSKKHYRKYNISKTEIGDDYAMLREVLARRLSKLEEIPDLLLIDGGEGHLSTAKQVLDELNLQLPLVCISKGIDRNAGKEIFHQIDKEAFTLDKHSPIMKYLQIIRDEAHRFAITSHRKKRQAAMNFSILKQIPGIGAKRRQVLINHFTSIEEIKNSNITQLIKLEGINKKIADSIVEFFSRVSSS